VRRSDGRLRGVPPWLVLALGGVVATILYAVDVAAVAAFAAVGISGVAAMIVGPRRNRVTPRLPWRLLGAAAALFLAGALIRPVVANETGVATLMADAITLCGFLTTIACLAAFLEARTGIERHALIDGLIVCIGAAVASTLLFALPAASIPGRPVVVSIIAGLFPLLDAILLLLVVNLAFTAAVRYPSFIMLMSMMLLVFAGDLAYAIIGATGQLYGNRLLDLPFLLAYAMGGAAALHPSSRELVRPSPSRVQAWSLPRLLVLVPAVAVPFVLTVTLPELSTAERVILGFGGAAIVLLLITRAVAAVQSHAAAQRRYEYQATHDPLTGLPNRRMFTNAVDRLLAAGRNVGRGDDAQVWVFFLDLDGFKFVNDSWGHPAGDQLIVDLGERMRRALPPSVTVARLGGDEFIVVRRCVESDAMALAQQIMTCVEEPLWVQSGEVVITASMGIASAGAQPDPDVSAESLMRDADTAMYRTKAQGRGRWTMFDASMRDAVRERIDVEVALRTAVAQERLTVAYQPIVDLESGRPVGAEALVRWEHPVRGPISPTVFIPIAEDSNLINVLGAWVLRQSVRQMAAWRATGVVDGDFWISINVSPRQLTDGGFAGMLAAELRDAGVPACCVALEITESVMVEGAETTEHLLREVRALGVRIAVDDFGTGFSALGYLRSYPVTGVKIDRSFVAGLGRNAEDEEIVRAVVAMSAALGLAVVAEGVETAEQRAVLAAMGVTLAQGWLWGRAVDPQRFAERWAPTALEYAPETGIVRLPTAPQVVAHNQAVGNAPL
jgi:diguanylate cyclase (GGDEF)-like protein